MKFRPGELCAVGKPGSHEPCGFAEDGVGKNDASGETGRQVVAGFSRVNVAEICYPWSLLQKQR
jgi:hypothetical protein